MHVFSRASMWLTAALVALVVTVAPAAAQNVTTGTLSGVVIDDQGGVLPGVDVTAVHVPTGTTYTAVTQGDGKFYFLNVRVGGPYSVTVKIAGFREQTQENVTVLLGEETPLEFKLQLETVTEEVTVTAESNPVFSGSKTGTSASVGNEVIQSMPTIARSLQDFARLNPFVVQTATNSNPSALSIAGRSGRYNNVQIDGAVNNDLFGLADTATPGGQASTEPVSLDAIQEIQIVVSPYDVRQGGFSGGGVNAITKGGTNSLRGSGYYFFRDQDWVGDGVDDRPIATFKDKQFGVSLGGPILRNKAFFFANYDGGRKDTPTGFSIDGSSGQSFGAEAEAQRFLSILQNKYGYNPGGIGEATRVTNNDKFFVRGDVNLGKHQLTLRNNFIDAINDIGFPSSTRFIFPDNFYHFNSQQNSFVGQLNSTFGNAMFNEFRMTYQRIRDFRATDTEFPQVNIRNVQPGKDFRIGTEQFSTANELDQDIIEIHNDLTLVRGRHQFTFGTHNEFFKFRNLFIRDNNGTYEFASLDLFEQGLAQSYDYSFSNTSDPEQSAEFWVYQLGFYAGDQWRVTNRVTLTYGLRLDFPIFPDKPSANPAVSSIYGKDTDVAPSSQTWSPRAGFNWDLSTDTTRQQVRGGLAVFGGRTPYVWLSNQYTNTGLEFTRVNTGFNNNNRIVFVPDPNNQPTNVGNAATNEINLVDPDYTYPQLLRGNLAYDRSLGWQGLVASAEFLFSKTLKDITYENLNLVEAGTRPDGRPFYRRANSAYSDVVYLTNTDEGNSWNVAFKLDRPFRNGWFANASYSFGRSKTVNDGGSSQARSNWINNWFGSAGVNNPAAGISNFDPAHRVNLSAAYQIPIYRGSTLTLSAYYNGQSGRPYAYRFFNDVNVDAGTTNDLFYIPSGPSDVIIANGTFDQLQAFLDAGDCKDLPSGGIVEKNTCRSPWVNTLDFKAAVEVPIGRVRTEIELAILNLINLFDSKNGLIEYATFNGLPVARGDVDASGVYRYTLDNRVINPSAQRFDRDDLRSRWQAQLGLRVRF